jgi:hypothetical protein
VGEKKKKKKKLNTKTKKKKKKRTKKKEPTVRGTGSEPNPHTTHEKNLINSEHNPHKLNKWT